MSNKIIAQIITDVEAGKAELINNTVDELKKIKGKSFKNLVENNPDALYPFGQRLNWYELKKHGRGVRRIQRNADLFSVDEVIAAGEQIFRKDKRPMVHIPVKTGTSRHTKALWLDEESDDGVDALVEKPGRSLAASDCYQIPAIAGMDYKIGAVIEPDENTIIVQKTKANVQWHAVPAVFVKTKKGKKAEDNPFFVKLRQFEKLLAKAEKAGNKDDIGKFSKIVNSYRTALEESREAGAKAKADNEEVS